MQQASSENIAGFFGPESETWKIYREPTFIFGSIRALLLQVAHPAVAEGVARYSNFEKDAFGRGKRTFEAMTLLYFGDKNQAVRSAEKMNNIQRRISGSYQKVVNGEMKMIPYSADDPSLKLWILATLIDTTLLVYENMLAPLSLESKNRFYEESKVAARLLEIPDEVYPPDYDSFQQYFQNMLNGEELFAGEAGKKISKAILGHRLSPKKLSRLLAVGFLPSRLRDDFEIPRKNSDERKFRLLLAAGKMLFRIVPSKLRWVPAYHQAQRRVTMARNLKPNLMESFYGWLERFGNLPLGIPKS